MPLAAFSDQGQHGYEFIMSRMIGCDALVGREVMVPIGLIKWGFV
jgi:hypothetical protein